MDIGRRKCFFKIDGCQVAYDGDSFVGVLDIPEEASLTDAFQALAYRFAQINGLPKSDPCETDTKVSGTPTMATSVMTSVGLNPQSRKSTCYQDIKTTTFSYSLNTSGAAITFFWDMDTIINSLPDNFIVDKISVVAYGNARSSTGRTILGNVSVPNGGIDIPTNRFPISVNFEIVLNTPCGNIIMRRSVFTNEISGQFTDKLDVIDAGVDQISELSQEDFNKNVDVRVKDLSSMVSRSSQIKISNTKNTEYPTTDPREVISINAGYIDELFNMVSKETTTVVNYKNTKFYLQDVIDDISTRLSSIESDIASIKAKNVEQDSKIRENEAVITRIDTGI